LRTVAISPSGRVATGGSYEQRISNAGEVIDTIYRRRAHLQERQGLSDAFLVVGDMGAYYSFQPGNHPRLFFSAQDIPELRFRATQEPHSEMVQRMIESLDQNGSYGPIDLERFGDRGLRALTRGFMYILTGDEDYAIGAREDVEWVLEQQYSPWASPSVRGLDSYRMATQVALAYDWCAMSPHWDDAFLFRVSKALVDIA
ncbi:hypothetical protein RZS08_16670, partial [Arthrospira platensis SPKY1]|nr:hypothetical protein [Arthrospira platensis SPKY1]